MPKITLQTNYIMHNEASCCEDPADRLRLLIGLLFELGAADSFIVARVARIDWGVR